MANEISLSASFTLRNENLVFQFAPGVQVLDQTTQGGPSPGYMTVGTTEETVTFGEISTLGFAILQNLDDTNYVQWGRATGSYIGRIRPGRFAILEFEPGITLYIKANTAACKVAIYAFEA